MRMTLSDGSRVGVIGGGPAGSLFAKFLLTFGQRIGLRYHVDIYEPRDFSQPGPAGCNMCGGIVSESLVQALAADGITLPPEIVQRGIDSYVLHTDTQSVRLGTPLKEKRIAAIHRGGGPRDLREAKWGGLDGYLLRLVRELGANVIPRRVDDVSWEGQRPVVRLSGSTQPYDLLVGATGVNSAGWYLYEKLGLRSTQPKTSRAYITEVPLGFEAITRYFGSAMQIFLLTLPHMDVAAIIPKGDYLTVCLLGRAIDHDLVTAFFQHPAVARCFPPQVTPGEGVCHCGPRINVSEASRPFADRVVLVGDCGVTRLYKDGIGAAYRTAKAAAKTAVFSGVSSADFRKRYWPVYRAIAMDNRYGMLVFFLVRSLRRFGPLREAVLRMAEREQADRAARMRMSTVLWDMFTGSAPYREIFLRTLEPGFVGRYLRECVRGRAAGGVAHGGGAIHG